MTDDKLLRAIADLYEANRRGIAAMESDEDIGMTPEARAEVAALLRSANEHLLAEVEMPPAPSEPPRDFGQQLVGRGPVPADLARRIEEATR